MLAKKRFLLFLKGAAMGAADVVPGVSGGTIAFITGIYEELISTISRIGPDTFRSLRQHGIKQTWKEYNGSFIATLLLGILTSIASLAVLIKYLLENHAIVTWAFFFGLVLASVWIVGKRVQHKSRWQNLLALIIGTGIAYFVTIASPSAGSQSLLYIFLCGMLAITAMILPGISGSFILLLLGAYTTVISSISGVIDAIKTSEWPALWSQGSLLVIFAAGCVIGLLAFSRVLKLLFDKAHDITVSLLTGFLIGSLNKIWPWKEVKEYFVKHEGTLKEEIIPLVEQNISPTIYEGLYAESSMLFPALFAASFGMILILVLDRFSPAE